jgi:PAS domain-containing protein
MAEMDGQPVAAHPGRTIRDLAPDFADLLEPIVRRVLATGEPIRDLEIEGESPTRPGERRTWIGQWFPQTDAGGTIVRINIVAEDVTERKRIERELRDRAEELEAVLDAVPAVVCWRMIPVAATSPPTAAAAKCCGCRATPTSRGRQATRARCGISGC